MAWTLGRSYVFAGGAVVFGLTGYVIWSSVAPFPALEDLAPGERWESLQGADRTVRRPGEYLICRSCRVSPQESLELLSLLSTKEYEWCKSSDDGSLYEREWRRWPWFYIHQVVLPDIPGRTELRDIRVKILAW